MPRVSVLLASYNHAKFIKRTIESVQRQTFQDFEIIVVIDGSTDNTRDVLSDISDERLHVYELPYNQGISAASNEGLKHCRGEYIAILDSDDMFREDKLARQVEFLDQHPEYGTVCTQASLIDENDLAYEDKTHPYYTIFKEKNRSQAEWLKHFFFIGNCICHPSIMARKDVFDQVGQYNVSMQQVPDYDIVVRLAAQAPFYIIEEEMVYVRIRRDAMNNSAYSAEKDLRNQFEQVELLETYANLPVELASEVFEDYLEGVSLTEKMVPYVVAKAALATSWACAKYFGEKTLSRLLKSEENREILNRNYGFTTKKFYEMLGLNKVFDSMHIDVHKLYAAKEADFRETFKLEKPTRIYYLEKGFYEFDHIFTLNKDMVGLKHFRWDPTESSICGIWIEEISAKDENGVWHAVNLEKVRTNAVRKIRNSFIFLTTDPMVLFETECVAVEIKIKAVIEYAWDFLIKKYPEILEKALEEYHEYYAEKEFYAKKLYLKEKGTQGDIGYILRGERHEFCTEIPVQAGKWTQLIPDERLYEQNQAVVIRNMVVEGRGLNGEPTGVTVVAATPTDDQGGRILLDKASMLMVLPDHKTVALLITGTVERFAGWDLSSACQPAAVEGHPLKKLKLKYFNGPEAEETGSDAILDHHTATVVFWTRYLPQNFSIYPCNEILGAMRVKELYAIDGSGNRIALRVKSNAYRKWDFFPAALPQLEIFCEGAKENSVIILKYDIILGGLRRILKQLVKRDPAGAFRLLAKKLRNKIIRR